MYGRIGRVFFFLCNVLIKDNDNLITYFEINMDNKNEGKERCKYKGKREMLYLMVRHIHMGCERSEIAEKLTKHDGFWFFFLQCPLPPYLYEPQKSIFVLFKSYKILPFATPWTFVLATHLRLKTVLQLLLHMSWLFVHKIEDNFLEILSPRFVEVLFNSFIIDISFRKQSKMALLKLSVKLMDFKTIVIFPMGIYYYVIF